VDYADTGKKQITLIVRNNEQCVDTFTLLTETLLPDFFFHLPNAFSPSAVHIGLNDVFKPVSSQYIYRYELEIFNRWGEKVFATNDVNKGWDGTYMGQPCEQGAYLCRIYVVPLYGKLQHIETSLTLLR
jgi:gliding motility-associated-like protein